MPMHRARLLVAGLGLPLPLLARLPGGLAWLAQLTDSGWQGLLFLSGCNAIAWLAMLGISLLYRRPLSLLAPCLPGFGFLAWGYFSLDLAADAQAAIGLVILPIYALAPIALGGLVGYLSDRRLRAAG